MLSAEYCDFCVCIFAQNEENDLHIERIVRDEEFWSVCVEKAHYFFRTAILPELLGKWYNQAKSMPHPLIPLDQVLRPKNPLKQGHLFELA